MAQNSGDSDWTKVLEVLKSDLALPDDAIGLLALQLKFRLEDIKAVAAESVTGGGDDKKCDILFLDKELQVAVIAQCYQGKNNNSSAPANKAADLNTAVGWILTRDLSSLPEALRARAEELRTAIASGDVRQIFIWYVHNLPESKNVSDELKTVEHSARSALARYANSSDINIFAEEIGKTQFARLYAQAERTIIVTDSLETKVPDALVVSAPEWSSVVTTVSAKWLAGLFATYATDLFSANLRGYLGSRSSDSNINNGIKTTAQDEPENFWVYNNGVTALVINFELGKRTRSGRKLVIDGISIVNGAQTTGSLGSVGTGLADDVMVPIRFVRSNKESIISSVVRFNNLQNKLQAADFRSTDQIQERLRSEFSKIPNADYEGGRRGGASDTIRRSKFTLPSYTVGQSLAAFHGDPVIAYDKKSDIWTGENIYRKTFTDRTSARHIVLTYSLLEEINQRRLQLAQKARVDPGSLTKPDRDSLDFLNKKGAAFLLVYTIAMCMETIIGRPISNRCDLRFKANLSPERAQMLWIPIVDLMLSLSSQLNDAFNRNRISNESIEKAVPKFVGLIESLKQIHHKTFSDFAKEVELVT